MKLKTILPVVIGLGLSASAFAVGVPQSDQEKISYSIGADLGSKFKQQSIEVNPEFFFSGFKDGASGKETVLSKDEMIKTLRDFQRQLAQRHAKEFKAMAEKNSDEGESFLAKNKTEPGVITLPSGLQYKIEREGKGKPPKASDTVLTHYRGTFIDGTEFDSSYARGEPTSFPVDGVIPGWSEALQLMKPNSKWRIFVPANLAYGVQGAGNRIGPNQTLIFDVELLSVQKSAKNDNK